MSRIMKPMVIILMLSALFSAKSHAQTINAASCNAPDVQKAFNSATSSTTTINIPAGTCHWTSQAAFFLPSGNTNLSILGAGSLTSTGGGDVTVIIDDDSTDGNFLLQFNLGSNTNVNFRIAGFTVKGGLGITKANGIIAATGSSHNFRADHFHLDSTTYANQPGYVIMRVTGWIYGVIDHSLQAGNFGIEHWLDNYNGSNDGAGYASWADNTNFGSANFLFIEDNVFNGPPAGAFVSDCYAGGRMVFRYNTMSIAGIDVHPTGGGGQLRGCRAVEIYNNNFTGSNSTPEGSAFWDSSGTALVYNNTAPVGYNSFIDLHSMRINNSTYAATAAPSGWGYCGTNFNGTGSPWDQNSSVATGYRCLDEPGTGKSDLLINWFPNTVDSITGTITWPNQALEPVYEWLNQFVSARGILVPNVNNAAAPALSANIDWYAYTMTWNGSAWTGVAFNGTVGTGSGLLSARPATCTTGVAYWATDTDTLYKCTTTNTWNPFYTPYTYPHPLDVNAAAPAPAKNLQVNGIQ